MITAVLASLAIASLADGEPAVHPLFKIERSKNANVIQYDARSGEDGKLLAKKPVIGYWIRLAEQGQKKKLTWLQSRFAYGFRTHLAKDRESAMLDMVVDLGSPLTVIKKGDRYRAAITIDGETAYLDRVFVHSSGSGLKTKLDYIELYGTDIESGKGRYQKITK